MPAALLRLPQVTPDGLACAGDPPASFLEVFAGDCVLRLAMSLTDVGPYMPWDLRYGQEFDVTVHGRAILQLAEAGALFWVHLGTPCQSMTWARCPQLRTTACPLGRGDLTKHQAQLVAKGNELAKFSLNLCCCQAKHGRFFSIENPEYSWLWVLPQTIELRHSEGVAAVRFQFSEYFVPCCKPTLVVHNSPFLHVLAEGVLPWRGPKVKLRGLALFKGKHQFRTHLAQTYPPLLGLKFADAVSQTLTWASLGGDLREMSDSIRVKSHHLPLALQQAESEVVANCCVHWKLVPSGLRAVKGLSPLEHVAFALQASHPGETQKELPAIVQQAVTFECQQDAASVDAFRLSLLEKCLRVHAKMELEHKEWTRCAPVELHAHASAIHGPLWKVLLQQCELPHAQFLHDLQFGFPLVGELPPCEGDSVDQKFEADLTVRELESSRQVINRKVLGAVSELPFSADILPQTVEDAKLGFMSFPRALVPEDVSHLSLTRRIPVREERSKGWRTRIVDHETESMINAAAVPCDKIRHNTLDDLASMTLAYFQQDCKVLLWKRDISKAFRRVPIRVAHLVFAWTVWLHDSCLMVAQHKGMPFGTVSAVYAWHRVGFMLCSILQALFLCPAARYVDDFFGASRLGVRWHAGRILTVVSKLLGFPVDDDKSAENDILLIVLGAECRIDWPRRQLSTRVDPVKAVKYRDQLLRVILSGKLTPGDASKLAGRLSFSVTLSGNRVGRAFIKPFHAQAHKPLYGNATSPLLRQACEWFLKYLECCPTSVRVLTPLMRPSETSWTDASGESHFQGTFYWTRARAPDQVWRLLQPRGDHQIGFQEFLAVLLAWATFKKLLQASLWLNFVDNDSVLHAISHGSGGNDETSLCIGRLWLEIAAAGVDLHVGRVESAANIADGPTGDRLQLLACLKATFVPPELPSWVHTLWEIPSIEQ